MSRPIDEAVRALHEAADEFVAVDSQYKPGPRSEAADLALRRAAITYVAELSVLAGKVGDPGPIDAVIMSLRRLEHAALGSAMLCDDPEPEVTGAELEAARRADLAERVRQAARSPEAQAARVRAKLTLHEVSTAAYRGAKRATVLAVRGPDRACEHEAWEAFPGYRRCADCSATLPTLPGAPFAPERACEIPARETAGAYECTRAAGHAGSCATQPRVVVEVIREAAKVSTSAAPTTEAEDPPDFWVSCTSDCHRPGPGSYHAAGCPNRPR